MCFCRLVVAADVLWQQTVVAAELLLQQTVVAADVYFARRRVVAADGFSAAERLLKTVVAADRGCRSTVDAADMCVAADVLSKPTCCCCFRVVASVVFLLQTFVPAGVLWSRRVQQACCPQKVVVATDGCCSNCWSHRLLLLAGVTV
uniref:Secreted protein n=1 Tax=Knipowitschia caucasica TaxID=637954 RepID=A0AAV2MI26_KNICA